ncbi:39S ribosomal protein L52, mitochondrial [Exaiptasia diaphana]|uniref:Large ribosomal subunit protein mL52 n=1 Tax=Exaiptasia diaphana TaxID=2652724 RepID=A0A913X6T1_EXADI|nr:39S ribosomal protein L52, mitochondrial [Exaiptasia diaphana]KXJ14670.1 39S ribosomal protein L52, mitochondrial [Exaiptasia diaphana]
MAAVLLRRISPPIPLCNLRMIATCRHVQAGQKWRTSHGQAPDGLRYGPLTDKPDWSYADGRLAPETARRKRRMRNRLDVAQRISQLLTEIDEAKENTEQRSSSAQGKY